VSTLAKILYIEDDVSLSQLAKRRLERHDYEVELALDGHRGIEMIQSTHFDVLIVDYHLPELSGIQVLERLAELDISIPAIMVSGGDDISVAVNAMKLGCFDYIIKDVGSSYLELLPVHLATVMSRRQLELKQQEVEVEKNRIQQRLVQAQHLAHLGNWEWHVGSRTAWWSDEEYRIFGVDQENFDTTLKHYESLVHTDDAALVERMVTRCFDEGECETFEYRIVRPSGETRWLYTKIESESDVDGKLLRCFGITQDITERKQSDKQLQLAQQVFVNTTEAILVTDANAIIVSVNPAFTEITGFSEQEALGQSPNILKSGKHDDEFYKIMWDTLETKKQWAGEIWNRKKNGELFPEWLAISAISDDNGDIEQYVSIFSDITQHKEAEKQIKYQANYDALTGLLNRNLFNDRLARTLTVAHREQHVFALLFLDLDRFKWVNDTFGHRAGDFLLKETASRLTSATRESDSVCRLGGDEFIVILPNLHSGLDAEIIADKILEKLAQPFQLEEQQVQISASIGIAVYPEDGRDAEVLYQNADSAMYAAKAAGRNQISFFTADLQQKAEQRLILVNELTEAIEGNEFEIYYQPIIDAKDGSLYGAEALIRWHHPKRGLISPTEFISLAEDSGLIQMLDIDVFRTAIEQMKKWQEQGYNLHVSVNKSYKQFHSKAYSEEINELLRDIGVAPENLTVEMKEAVSLAEDDESIKLLRDYNKNGICISLDDFGTGYSSISSLHRSPFKLLKIDRTLINKINKQASEPANFVDAIISIAHKLDLKVVAEGVETEDQKDFLVAHECDFLQGYLFSPAIPVFEFEQQFLNSEDWRQPCQD